MDEKAIADLIASAEIAPARAEKAISSRRYNLVVFRFVNGEKQVVETAEYLTMRQARELKAAYMREDNLRSDIVEDVTVDRNGNELTFPPRNDVPVVKGIGGFGTPAATDRIIERGRRNNRNKASFARKANKVKAGKTIRWINTWTDPKSPLHEMYLDNVARKGYTIKNKITREVFRGLQDEVVEYLLHLAKVGVDIKNDLDISFNGV